MPPDQMTATLVVASEAQVSTVAEITCLKELKLADFDDGIVIDALETRKSGPLSLVVTSGVPAVDDRLDRVAFRVPVADGSTLTVAAADIIVQSEIANSHIVCRGRLIVKLTSAFKGPFTRTLLQNEGATCIVLIDSGAKSTAVLPSNPVDPHEEQKLNRADGSRRREGNGVPACRRRLPPPLAAATCRRAW